MTKRFGFTLAEVLITLGIIGVVAAMTMPTLMNSTQGAQYRTAFKKALSAISQAVTLNVALDEWNFADTEASGDYTVQKMLQSRMNVVDTKTAALTLADGTTSYTAKNTANQTGVTSDAGTEANITLFFNDGIMFSFPSDAAGCTQSATAGESNHYCKGIIDVNGLKGPNKIVKCDTGEPNADGNCQVTNPTDVFPVQFYDQRVEPSTEPGRQVLFGK